MAQGWAGARLGKQITGGCAAVSGGDEVAGGGAEEIMGVLGRFDWRMPIQKAVEATGNRQQADTANDEARHRIAGNVGIAENHHKNGQIPKADADA